MLRCTSLINMNGKLGDTRSVLAAYDEINFGVSTWKGYRYLRPLCRRSYDEALVLCTQHARLMPYF